jgi:integration host factor subunit beta
VEVPSKRIPYFKPSKELRDLVNSGNSTAAQTESAPAATHNGELKLKAGVHE